MGPRTLVVMLVAVAALGMPAKGHSQVAMPRPASLLTGLGLPEITITATDFALELSPTIIPAGRYLFTLDNHSWDPDLEVFVLKLAVENLATDTSCQEGLPPECFNWYAHTYIPGGVSGWAPQVILDLPAGTYGLWGPGELSILPAATLTVTGDPDLPVEGPEPQTVSIIATKTDLGEELTLKIEGKMRPGPQIVAIVNAADQPIFINVGQHSAIAEQTGAFLSPEAIDPEQFVGVMLSSPQSVGTRQWLVVNLRPGPAYLACYFRDPISVADVSGWYRVAAAEAPVPAA